MKRCTVFFGLFLLLCFLFTSCRTTETVTEYVPIEVDVSSLAQPILQLRPEPVTLIEDVQTLADAMSNSVAFQKSYMEWRDYALTLEDFITNFNNGQELL